MCTRFNCNKSYIIGGNQKARVLKDGDEPIGDDNSSEANQNCTKSDGEEVTSTTVSSKAGGRKRKAASQTGVIHNVLFCYYNNFFY